MDSGILYFIFIILIILIAGAGFYYYKKKNQEADKDVTYFSLPSNAAEPKIMFDGDKVIVDEGPAIEMFNDSQVFKSGDYITVNGVQVTPPLVMDFVNNYTESTFTLNLLSQFHQQELNLGDVISIVRGMEIVFTHVMLAYNRFNFFKEDPRFTQPLTKIPVILGDLMTFVSPKTLDLDYIYYCSSVENNYLVFSLLRESPKTGPAHIDIGTIVTMLGYQVDIVNQNEQLIQRMTTYKTIEMNMSPKVNYDYQSIEGVEEVDMDTDVKVGDVVVLWSYNDLAYYTFTVNELNTDTKISDDFKFLVSGVASFMFKNLQIDKVWYLELVRDGKTVASTEELDKFVAPYFVADPRTDTKYSDERIIGDRCEINDKIFVLIDQNSKLWIDTKDNTTIITEEEFVKYKTNGGENVAKIYMFRSSTPFLRITL